MVCQCAAFFLHLRGRLLSLSAKLKIAPLCCILPFVFAFEFAWKTKLKLSQIFKHELKNIGEAKLKFLGSKKLFCTDE